MKHWVHRFLVFCLGMCLSLRYRVKVKGLDQISRKKIGKSGGTLFLPNHPTLFTDPLLVSWYTFARFRPRALITEYMYFSPVVYRIMKWIRALPIPVLSNSTNSYKVYRTNQAFSTCVKGLGSGENFLIYPSGRTKSSGLEIIGGASGVHNILQEVPNVNVVLVRTTGLWGSIFSRAVTGQTPDLWKTIWIAIKAVFKAGIFFLPRRKVVMEFEQAPKDFPYNGSRLELNRWLEEWYNRPFQAGQNEEKPAGESLAQVSLSPWRQELPPIAARPQEKKTVLLEKVDPVLSSKILAELARMTKRAEAEIKPDMDLAQDLGLDSLDGAELIAFMEEELQINRVHPEDLTTVKEVLGIASGQIKVNQEAEEVPEDTLIDRWRERKAHPKIELAEGVTLGEVFLRSCDRLDRCQACVDPRGGVLSYRDLKMRVLLMAEVFSKLPGERIGVMLPASIGASVLILALQLAGKVPVMINWTVGSRHLDTVVEQSEIKVVLTAWAFIDRLDNVDLGPIHDRIVLMEEVGFNLTLWSKLKAFWRARCSVDRLLSKWTQGQEGAGRPAGILFTSGTEKAPKGVPLTHANVISNLRATLAVAPIDETDVLLSMLPPFHSFGFTLTGLLPLLCGVPVVYSPDPTDGARLVREISRWGVTLVVGAPTFLKGILKAGSKEQLKSVTAVLSGAERVSPEVVAMTKALGEKVRFLEGYGITECSPVVTVQSGKEEGDTGVGKPIPGITLKVVHPDSHEELSIGERGLILVHGPNVFGGYLTGQSLESPFMDLDGRRWYITGDLGFMDERGNLHIAGRLKRFVKVGGEMISLTAIEAALLEVAPSRGWLMPEEGPALAVSAREYPDTKPDFFLFTRFTTTQEEISAALKEQGFSNLVKISEIFCLPEIPITGTGKTNYRALENKYLTGRNPTG